MHGDFEAQRHWMEITLHLPISQWYFHDLEWWGLDYPPLTAYHSWVLGKLGSMIDPNWFTLYNSRGLDDPNLKIYMRATVLVSEYLTFVPALITLTRSLGRIQRVDVWERFIAVAAIMMQPGLLLIDHGHFQYNGVMLGLTLASLSSFYANRPLWCCFFFVASLGYKQMALYYAPAIFVCLLGVCCFPRLRLGFLVRIALVTLLSFSLLFAPLLLGGLRRGVVHHDPEKVVDGLPILSSISILAPYLQDHSSWYYPAIQQLAQSVHRIFPFARGIFEDKVANLWCVANNVIKLRQYPTALLQRASLAATFVTILPPCIILFLRPRSDALLYGLASTAWGFFLCSFQVHEKSILLPLLPMTVLLAQRDGLAPSTRAWVGLANELGVWTMYPLLKRDELKTPYVVVSLLWAYLLGLPPTSFSAYHKNRHHPNGSISSWENVLHWTFYALMVVWHMLEASLQPPEGKPDLWVVLNAAIGAAGFGLCYLWCLTQCLTRSGLMESKMMTMPAAPKTEPAAETGAKSPVRRTRYH
ncbi:MAG: Glucosyltransferase-like protein [Peltula sp. TS41687]|nr:MAG: Glucosyltransferase-like protein [Peltula sp. TS41687]